MKLKSIIPQTKIFLQDNMNMKVLDVKETNFTDSMQENDYSSIADRILASSSCDGDRESITAFITSKQFNRGNHNGGGRYGGNNNGGGSYGGNHNGGRYGGNFNNRR